MDEREPSKIAEGLWAGELPAEEDAPWGVPWSRLGFVQTLVSLTPPDAHPPRGVRHLQRYIDDTPELAQAGVSEVWLDEIVALLERRLARRERLYVHCHAGISRTGLVLTAWACRRLGQPPDLALSWLRERRPVLAPNEGFEVLLEVWWARRGAMAR